MSYLLLTGATGLLGAYLLRDAVRQEIPLAVVVRSSRTSGKARQRIEDQMVRWERQAGHDLPRPVILEGDLGHPQLGLSAEQLGWVARNCDALLHNAASLTFVAKDPMGEPYASNVGGVKNVLELCRATGIRTLHHVSTAYVCGLREGRVLESELDVGQTLGNDYERSKLEAERMVLDDNQLRCRTVFRPAIITGDSRNGYTSTFHGLYVPLKAAFGLVQALASGDDIDLGSVLEAFSMEGSEKKNFVPVDWVSAVMMHVIANPRLHNQTYHLTPTVRTEVGLLAEVIQETLLKSLANGTPRSAQSGQVTPNMFFSGLIEQMDVYRSYWRDDPEFDASNTLRAAPHLPCPAADRDLLRRMCQYAIRSNFGWPKSPPSVPPWDSSRLFVALGEVSARTESAVPDGNWVGFRIHGPGGGDWRLKLADEQPIACHQGLDPDCRAVINLSSRTLRELLVGELEVSEAVALGRLVWEASPPLETLWIKARVWEALQGLSDKSNLPAVAST